MSLLDRPIAAAGAGLAAVAAVVAFAAPAAAAPASYIVTTNRVQAAAGWLATQFVDRSHLPAPDGDRFVSGTFGGTTFINYGENADAIFGLAAAKAAGAKAVAALDYLAHNVDAYADLSQKQGFGPADGGVGKLALAALVENASATSFGGYNLLQRLKDDECTAAAAPACPAAGSGRNTFTSNGESFVILAEARAGGAYAPSPQALRYFLSLQCTGGADSGGFTVDLNACGSGPADLDATSYAIMALEAVGKHRTKLANAVAWLQGQQQAGGYFVSQGVPNTNSTGLAAAALEGAGVDVSKARSWLLSQQVAAGHAGAGALKFGGTLEATTTSATSKSVLATAQALTGLVHRGSLATVTASGAGSAVPLFAPTAGVSATTVRVGAHQSATGTGFVAGERVQVSIHSTPVTVATATAGPLGTVNASYTVPSSVSGGAHTVVITGLTSGLVARRPIIVAAAASSTAAPSSSVTTATVEPTAGQTVAATGQDRRHLSALSVAGVASVLSGCALLVAGRRRRRAH